ncbi:MAG: carbamate kinase [Candidatus Hodarchaeota archaeon]
MEIAVVAIGGNALSSGQSSIDEQMEKANFVAINLIRELVLENFRVVVVHGNGPQVGMAYLQQLAGIPKNIPPLNLSLCNAVTQGTIGAILEAGIINSLNRDLDVDATTLITQVEVRADDPAFKNFTKPIGPFYTEKERDELQTQFPDWKFKKDPGGKGFRRVVPSPIPINVFGARLVRDILQKVNVVVIGGGGGIPVVRNPDNTFEFIDAVIDKDRTAYLVAKEVKASHFFLVTNVPKLYADFNTENQRPLPKLSVDEAQALLEQNQFPPGSMGPKVEAAIDFARKIGGTAIITDILSIGKALHDQEGTRIHS